MRLPSVYTVWLIAINTTVSGVVKSTHFIFFLAHEIFLWVPFYRLCLTWAVSDWSCSGNRTVCDTPEGQVLQVSTYQKSHFLAGTVAESDSVSLGVVYSHIDFSTSVTWHPVYFFMLLYNLEGRQKSNRITSSKLKAFKGAIRSI